MTAKKCISIKLRAVDLAFLERGEQLTWDAPPLKVVIFAEKTRDD